MCGITCEFEFEKDINKVSTLYLLVLYILGYWFLRFNNPLSLLASPLNVVLLGVVENPNYGSFQVLK